MKELAIYFKNGNVAYFKEVKHFFDYEDKITFSYFGQAPQLERDATFTKKAIAGYSLTTD